MRWVWRCWSHPGAAGEASPYTPVQGLVGFISQELSKMLNKSKEQDLLGLLPSINF